MSETELLKRSQLIEGLTFSQLISMVDLYIPSDKNQRKGLIGQAIELALGTTAKNSQEPDFKELGIELKTIPVNKHGKADESTYITKIPLTRIHEQTWKSSDCYKKLNTILWVPLESDKSISFANRRIGKAILWKMSEDEEMIIKNDWLFLTNLIITGKLNEISASLGQYLQIRPKGKNAKSLCDAFNEEGRKVKTLPRGFYLRSSFTSKLLEIA